MLTIIDKYSRFPFIIPCPDVTATTVIQGLCSLFAILGVPASIQPGIVLLKHHVHRSKHDPLISKVKLIEVNPQIETAEGRQSMVSLRDLTPAGNTSEEATAMENHKYPVFRTSPVKLGNQIPHTSSSDTLPNESDYPDEPSSTSDSEERPIPQKWPHTTSETNTYFSDTQ